MSPNESVAELNSTTLVRATYRVESAILQLEFRDGSAYYYSEVPASLHQELLRAVSPGACFNLRIRGRFPHRRVSPARRIPRRSATQLGWSCRKLNGIGLQPVHGLFPQPARSRTVAKS